MSGWGAPEEDESDDEIFSTVRPTAAELIKSLALNDLGEFSVGEEEMEHMLACWDYYDSDGGGFMDRNEFVKLKPELVRQELIPPGMPGMDSAGAINKVFDSIDNDGGGFIEMEEFLAWWFRDRRSKFAKSQAKLVLLSNREIGDLKHECGLGKVPNEEIGNMKAAFMHYDKDGSGILSKDEWEGMLPGLQMQGMKPEEVDEAFALLDADGSGEIEFTEFLRWWFRDRMEPVVKRTPEEKAELEKKKAAAKKQREELGVDSAELENVMDHAREMFQKYDADCGGTIDADEFAALCYDMGHVFEKEDRKMLLAMLDQDKDGTVSFKEFFHWWKKNKDTFMGGSGYSDDLKSAIYYFKKYDADMSGDLDASEFAAMCKEMKWPKNEVESSMKMLDTDGDGQIDFNEFLAWYTDDGMVGNIIKVYDKDKDGFLNMKEFTNMCKDWKLNKKNAEYLLKTYDADGDGKLGKSDMRGLMAKLKPPEKKKKGKKK